MKIARINALVDWMALNVALLMAASGLVLKFRLPAGSGQHRELWYLTRHQWGDAHLVFAVVFGMLVLAHVALHWRFVLSQIMRRTDVIEWNGPATMAVAFTACLVVFLVSIFVSPVVSTR